jgi:hypothetical protein
LVVPVFADAANDRSNSSPGFIVTPETLLATPKAAAELRELASQHFPQAQKSLDARG